MRFSIFTQFLMEIVILAAKNKTGACMKAMRPFFDVDSGVKFPYSLYVSRSPSAGVLGGTLGSLSAFPDNGTRRW